jgi:TetR/AcrR family transcriptional regulator, ethionamide resistance regulator
MERMGGERRRHRPEEAERIILSAARSFLREHPFREMTVERVMERTGLSRPSFYVYFGDRYELVTRLLEGVGGLLYALDLPWTSGDVVRGRGEAAGTLREVLRRRAEAFDEYGPVIRAISDAASYDDRIEEVYRRGLLERTIQAVGDRVFRDVAAGLSPGELDPRETARALVLMTERYLLDAYGGGPGEDGGHEAEIQTLEEVWVRTLYGP